MRAIHKHRLVMLRSAGALQLGTMLHFADVPELRGKRIVGIRYLNQNITGDGVRQSPERVQCGIASLATVTLMSGGRPVFDDVPLQMISDFALDGLFYRELYPVVVDWDASFVRSVSPLATNPLAFQFQVYYL